MKINQRLIALSVLNQQEQAGNPIDSLLEKELSKLPSLEMRDRNLVMHLIYGVLRQRGLLDFRLQKLSSHPLHKMKPATLQALRLGLFQLLFMDRIPSSAAINETIQALKSMRQPKWITGFVNGILRTADRKIKSKKGLPDPLKMPPEAHLNHPSWLLKRWQKRYGKQVSEDICRANNQQPPLTLLANRGKISAGQLLSDLKAVGIAAEPGNYAPDAVILPSFKGSISDIPGYNKGNFQIQDEAAQLATLLLAPFNAESYLDGCAGLGGKTCYLAMLTEGECTITASDPDQSRLQLLGQNLERLGHKEQVAIQNSRLEEIPQPLPGDGFQRILIDAPCSGIGVIRRHPEIRWSRTREDLKQHHRKQLQLLQAAASLVAHDGVLVYATCSTEPEEGEEVIKEFLVGNRQFFPENCRDFLPEAATELVTDSGFLATIPDQRGLDGFFAAKLKRK